MQSQVQKGRIKRIWGKGRLRQGDSLFPALFNIMLELVTNKTLAEATGIEVRNDQKLVVAEYVDYAIIMAECKELRNKENY